MSQSLDEIMLQYQGGVERNSLVTILEQDTNSTEELQICQHSPYYDFDKLTQVVKGKKNNFSIFSTNARSINANFSEIQIFVESLKENGFAFSAICVQESWLADGDDISQIQLDDYECIPQGKTCSIRGGLIIYLHKNFKYEEKMKLNTYDTWEGQFIKVKKSNTMTKDIMIGNIYRLPRELVENYQTFIDEFTPVITSLNATKSEIFMTGDYNIDLLKINEKPLFATYLDMFTNNSFYPKITYPTRFSNKHGTLIDNIFCRLSGETMETTSGILIKKFSDHQPYFTILDGVHTKEPPIKYIRVSKNDQACVEKFHDEIIAKLSSSNMNENLSQDPNVNYNILHDIIQKAKSTHMPTKLVRFNRYKHKKSKWITQGIIKSIHFRDALYKRCKITDPESLIYTTLKTNLANYNQILRKSIRLAQKNYYESLFTKFKDDIRNTWKTINDLLHRIKKKKSFPLFFKDEENNMITDKTIIANKFNSFFAGIGPKLANNISAPRNKNFKNYLTNRYTVKFHFQNINEEDLRAIIDKLAPKTSLGFDGLSTKLVKEVKEPLLRPLRIIINQMLNSGIFPDKLKIAKICPVYKKDEEYLFTNYRPISLLPAISKIFEKVIFRQLYEYFQVNKLLYKSQYGFRTAHSTEFAALEVIDRILIEMDKNDIPVNIYLDLSKAFDTLDHNILLEKLHYYGVQDTELRLMKSYLSNRKQYVDIENSSSDLLTVKTGVPQGSILGPLLFIIYINDICTASSLFDFIIYADDTTLSSALKVITRQSDSLNTSYIINNELNKINDWLKTNKLSLNIKKTKYMMFHTVQRKVPVLDLRIDGINIERVSQFSFLGLTLNENLTWHDHVNKIANKISKNIGVLNRLKHYIPLKTKLTIYNALILSHLNFCILAWGTNYKRLFTLQKKALRIIELSKYNAHTEPIFKKHKLLKLEDIHTLHQLKFYYKFKHHQLPAYLQNLPLNCIREIHEYPTRGQRQDDIRHPKINHEYMRKFIRFKIAVTVNDTPASILEKIETHSLQGYSNYIKTNILNGYKNKCTIDRCYICSRHN